MSGTIAAMCPVSSPEKVRFCVQLPCATIGVGDVTWVPDVPLQPARTMRATAPAARSMWSNVTHGARPGANDGGDAITRSIVLDRGRRCHRDMALTLRALVCSYIW